MVGHLAGNKVDLASQQLISGQSLQLDPKKEIFVGSGAKQSNPHLTREYRKPFVVPSANDV